MSAAQHMDMQMRDRFAAASSVVDHDAETVFGQTEFFSQIPSNQ